MFKERDKLAEGGAQAFEKFREDQANANSFAAEASKVAQSVGERVQSDQVMAEDAGHAVASAQVTFEAYGADKPPVFNQVLTDDYNEFAFTIDTIRKSFDSFDDYLKGSGAGLGWFLETVDVFAGDLISASEGVQEGMTAFRQSLAQSVAFGNLTQSVDYKFLKKYGDTLGAVLGQATSGDFLGAGAAGVGRFLGSLIPGAGPPGQALGASLVPAVTDGFRSLFSDTEDAKDGMAETASPPAGGGRRIGIRQTTNHNGFNNRLTYLRTPCRMILYGAQFVGRYD